MATKDGQKTGGRTKGTPNKVTREVREVISELVTRMAEGIGESATDKVLADMTLDERTRVLARLLPYIVPKVQPIEDRPLETKYVVLGMVTNQEGHTTFEHIPITPIGYTDLDRQIHNALPHELRRKVFPAGVINWVSTQDESDSNTP